MSENIHSRVTSARSNNLDKHANLNNGIRRQLIQLQLEFVQNINEDRVRRYAVTSGEEIFEHNYLIFLGIWNRFCARWWGVSFRNVVGETL
jgi:uncharacterized protein YigA (DUF484 family)